MTYPFKKQTAKDTFLNSALGRSSYSAPIDYSAATKTAQTTPVVSPKINTSSGNLTSSGSLLYGGMNVKQPTTNAYANFVKTGQNINTKPQVTPSDTAATGTTGTQLSPAGQTYASQVADIQQGGKDLLADWKEYQATSGKDKYLDYIKGQQNPDYIKNQLEARDKAAQRLADIQSENERMKFEARKAYEERLDKPGGTAAAAQQGATLGRRRSNDELADAALQENAAARSAQVAQGIYESSLEADRPLTLEEAEALNVPFGTSMSEARALGVIPSGTGAAGYGTNELSSLAEMVSKGQMKIENVPAEYLVQVASLVQSGGGIKKDTSPYLKTIADNGLNAVGGLLEIAETNPEIFGRTAALPLPGAARSDAFRNYEAQLDFLRGNIIPSALTAMREASTTGGALGQVSDREGAWLASSLGALSMEQDPTAVIKQLRLVEKRLNMWKGAVENPDNLKNYILPDGTRMGDVHPEYFDGSMDNDLFNF